MTFMIGTPLFLLLLLLLPCFIWCRPYNKHYYFSKLSWIDKQTSFLSPLLWLKIFIFSLMIFALSKPFIYENKPSHNKKGRDLVLSIDASGSMGQSGFSSKNRFSTKYESNILLASDFIKHRFDDNIGIVIFGTFAYTASPLTYDLNALQYLLNMTNVGIAGESTAIGDAIMQGIHTLSFGKAKNKAIILLTDGYHNAGFTSPKAAVSKASSLGIKIYTIGIGNPSDYDASLLQTIAKETHANTYAATSAEDLHNIYEKIDLLEPSKIRSENYLNQQLLILFPLSLAIILLFIWTFYTTREER